MIEPKYGRDTAVEEKSEEQSSRVMGDNPLEGEELLVDALYGRSSAARPKAKATPAKEKPTHYKVVSISLYLEDISRLEGLVREMKRRGQHKANKSQVIRQALAQFDPDEALRD